MAALALAAISVSADVKGGARLALLEQGGSIKGEVVADIPDQRKPLPGVVVYLSGERLGGKKLEAISDEEGRYDFSGLIAGDYVLSVELPGFKKHEQKLRDKLAVWYVLQ